MQNANVRPLIIAHRGASALAPENTFAAFQKAIDDGADGIEFDVRLAKDGVPVVFHDSTLNRTAKIEGRVSDFTSEELSKIDVGSWFNRAFPKRGGERFSAETVPTFEQLLIFLSDYKNLIYVELKGNNAAIPALAETVCRLIGKANLLPNIIVKSFNLEGIRVVKETLPEVRTAALFEPKILTILGRKERMLEAAQNCNADEISLHHSLATKSFVRRATEKTLPVTVWTTDNPVWVKRALDSGINAIITNNPAKLLTKRGEVLQNLL